LFSLAYLIATTLPNVSLLPNPPGIITPSRLLNFSLTLLSVKSFVLIQIFSIFTLCLYPECLSASTKDKYASLCVTYLPTIPIFKLLFNPLILFT